MVAKICMTFGVGLVTVMLLGGGMHALTLWQRILFPKMTELNIPVMGDMLATAITAVALIVTGGAVYGTYRIGNWILKRVPNPSSPTLKSFMKAARHNPDRINDF
jgi:hypothetical protein